MSWGRQKEDEEDQRMPNLADMGSADGSPPSRQVTVNLSPDQYERLFFRPGAPRRGDLAKSFGMSSSISRKEEQY